MIVPKLSWRKPFIVLFPLVACTALSAATYYVSESGDNLNPGTLNQPWKTIQKAASTMVAGDTCYIRAGTYRETVTPANSGTAGNPITYKAYAGETVVINGCDEVLGGWTVDSGNVYKRSVSLGLLDKNQVFVNGTEMVWEARWPDVGTTSLDGLLEFATATMKSGTNSTTILNASIPNYDWTGGSVWVASGERWFCWTGLITGFGPGSISLEDNSDPSGVMACKNGGLFFLYGVRDALDSPKEWYYDDALNELYLWMPDSSAPSGVEVKARLNGFQLSNRKFIHLVDLEFFATSIATDASSDSLVFDGLRMEHVYHSNKAVNNYGSQRRTGLILSGANHELINSEIAYSSGSGVFLEGFNHWIVNNYLHDHNYIGSYASALELVASDCVISHNTMMRTGRQVIGLRDSFESIIQYNDVGYAGYLTADLGLVYGNGIEGENLVVRYNWFHDNVSTFKGFGIYYDHGCRNIITHHNVIWNVPDSGIINNQYANYLLWYNNTSVNGGVTSIQSKWANNQAEDLHGSQYINNVLSGAPDIVASNYVLQNNFDNYSDLDANLVPTAGSAAIDAGMRIDNVSAGYIGIGTDAGANEFGRPPWVPGHDFSAYPVVDTTPSLPSARNLIINSSFERANLVPWVVMGASTSLNNAVNGSQAVVDGTTLMGNYSAKFGAGQSGIMQTVTGLQPDTEYELMGKFRVDPGESAHLGVKNHGGAELFGAVVTSTGNLWVKETLTFRTGPASTSAEIYAWKNSTGSGLVYFEDAGLQIIEPYLIVDGFEVALDDWSITGNVSLDPTTQSLFNDNGSDSQAVRIFDDATTSTKMDRIIDSDLDDRLYIQFDFRYTAGVQNAGFQLWGDSARGINLHLSGFGVNEGSIQNRNATEMVTLASGLLPDVWYRFNLTVEPASTGADSYALKVQSLESGTSFDFEVAGLPFQANLSVFDTIRFHFNVSPAEIVGGEFFIDNLIVSSSANELYYFDMDAFDGFDPSGFRLVRAGNNLSYLSWPSSPHLKYHLFSSSDLVDWAPYYTVYGTGEEITVEVDLPGPDSPVEIQSSIFYKSKPVLLK